MPQSILYTGPMKSGKSRALLDKARDLSKQGKSFLCCKSHIDTRNGDYIWSRAYEDNFSIPSKKIMYSKQIIDILSASKDKYDAIFIDEIMFLDSGIIGVIDYLFLEGIDLYASGLDLDFRKKYFPLLDYDNTGLTMEDVMAQFEEVVPLHSKCEVCGKKAELTKRVSSTSDSTIEVGDSEYQPRCLRCF